MNKEIKQQWVEALRSGDYKQGAYALRNINDGFCCLGVLCDIYHKETGKGGWGKPHNDEYKFKDGDVGESYMHLPSGVMQWAEISSSSPKVSSGKFISDLNDEGIPFEQIAKLIDAKF